MDDEAGRSRVQEGSGARRIRPLSSERRPSRRQLLGTGAGALVVAGAGAGWWIADRGGASRSSRLTNAITTREAGRPRTGRIVKRTLQASPRTIDLGGQFVSTWAFADRIPGEEIRVNVGDELHVELLNDLTKPTSVHWHGLALRNDMDGVPDVTMPAVMPGESFDYSFLVPHAGTYWFHPHVGVQLDTGLYAPLIVEDPEEDSPYDADVTLVLDDWTDGLGEAPEDILARLRADGMNAGGMNADGMNMAGAAAGTNSMSGMSGMSSSSSTTGNSATEESTAGAVEAVTAAQPLGSDTGDVAYAAHLINGRLPSDPFVLSARAGQRLRLRLINAGADTAYRVAVGGHRLTVTHSDGFPVAPVTVDTLILGMGERYDLLIDTAEGVFPIVAVAEGKEDPSALALLRTASGTAPPANIRPAELAGRLLSYTDLSPAPSVTFPAAPLDRQIDVRLQMVDGGRAWVLNGRAFPDYEALRVTPGERVRLNLINETMMFHPMHLHGHTFALSTVNGVATNGARKDTLNVLPMQSVSVDLEADNPGEWLLHCHNAYHGEQGMMTVMSYTV